MRLSWIVRLPYRFACLLLATGAATAQAAPTDIASAPLKTAGAKPNIMLILDDSGSMQWSYLGDSVKPNGYPNTVGYRNALCNKLYYDPASVYPVPVGADGVAVPSPPFAAAWLDGYLRGDKDIRVDLGSRFRAWRSFYSDPAQQPWDCWDGAGHCQDRGGAGNVGNQPEPAYYFVYKGQRSAQLGDNSGADDCKDTAVDSTSGGAANWTKVVVGPDSGPGGVDERQNFANWYSFYRTRILLMKTSLIRAVRDFDASYRIGYSTIGYTGADIASNGFLPIADFDAAQKTALYGKLASLISPASGTPLRGALSKAGRMYAARLEGASDPVQYACQQNFSLLSTDGYWSSNVRAGVDEDAGYGPLDLDGNPVGNRDALLPRPQYDGTLPDGSGGAANTLADVAAYYYQTDLRRPDLGNCTGALGTDVCRNNVPASDADPATHQHMSTFTLGLGVSGNLRYQSDYATAPSGDFANLRSGTANWPAPSEFGPARVDDLWHAAVNGGGHYFSAANSATLAATLSDALGRLRTRPGAAAAATSNLEPVPGDNFAFLASYRSILWDGELQARAIDPDTGAVSDTALWSASDQVRAQAEANARTIHTDDPGNQDTRLKAFAWDALNADQKALFSNLCAPSARLSQCGDFSRAQVAAADGEKLVGYLRGSSAHAGTAGASSALFRKRDRVLGDMVNAQPLYVAAPPFRYADAGYLAFQAARAARQPMVYAGANDGMLHAFRATGDDGGHEAWAYVPAPMLPAMFRLADRNYAASHRYFVDGSPVAGDICPKTPPATCAAGEWRTILVGGFGAGGRGYYALDITDPAAPKGLWQYLSGDDADLGLSFGNPVITKRADGGWVVAFASGYNNLSPGDGGGYLYVLDAGSGRLLQKIGTGAGSRDAPSGLARISAWVDSPSDNTARRIYGGDLLGNVWRFSIDGDRGSAVLLAQLGQEGGATVQPVTTRPELAIVRRGGAQYPVVIVGTGSYLGASDLASVGQQSIYVLKDSLQDTGMGRARRDGVLVRQTLGTQADGTRAMTTQPVDWHAGNGWYVDLNPGNATPGERVNTDMQVQLGVLKAVGNVPSADVCSQGGSTWLYALDLATGAALPTAPAGIRVSEEALLTGISTLRLRGGLTSTLAGDSSGRLRGYADPARPAGEKRVKRVEWREVAE